MRARAVILTPQQPLLRFCSSVHNFRPKQFGEGCLPLSRLEFLQAQVHSTSSCAKWVGGVDHMHLKQLSDSFSG